MLRRIAFATVLAVLIVSCRFGPGLAAAAPTTLAVPDALQGAWYVGRSCSDAALYVFLGDGWFVGIAEEADSEIIEADSSAFSVLRLEPDGSMIVSSYWEPPNGDRYMPAKIKVARSGSRIVASFISPLPAAKLPSVSGVRCDHPEIAGKSRPFQSRYLSDLTLTLDAVSAIQHACNSGTHLCAAAVIAALDLNHDGKISPAELVNFFRQVSKLGVLLGKEIPGTTILHAEFTLDLVTDAELGAAVVGPIFASIVMSNIDYNGDGFIEESELETSLREIGIPPGPGYFTQLIESAKGSADQAARSLGALQQLLGAFGGH